MAFSNLADRIGVTVTALHGLESGAAVKGINTSDFTTEMAKFADLSEAATHNMGSLAEEFRLSGVAVGTLEQNLMHAADLIANSKDDAARYSLITQLGLPQQAQWVEYLKQGSAGIKAATAAAVALGGETDESLVKKAKQFDEQWNYGWNNFVKYGKAAIIEVGGFLSSIEQKSDAFANSVRDKLGINPTKDLSADLGVNSIGSNLSADAGINDIGKPKTKNIVNVKNDLSQDNQRISVLGNLATVTDLVRQKQNELQLAFLAGSGVTKEQSAAILTYTHDLALGVIAIREQVAQQQLSLTTMNMGVGAATAYTAVQEKINAARIKGAPLADDDVVKLRKEASALGQATQAAALYKAQLDATFSRSLMGLADNEQAAAQAMRNLWGGDWQSHMSDDLATFLKVNSTLTDIKGTASDAFSGFAKDLLAGKSAADAFQGALTKIEGKLIDIATNAIISRLLGTLIGSIGGGGGGAPTSNPYSGMPAGSNPTFHTGGIVGSEGGPSRSLPMSVFAGAPRFHGGGLVSGEVGIVAQKGEGVFTKNQMRALAPAGSSGGNNVQVNVINQSENTQVKTQKRSQGGVDIHDVIISTVGKHMVNGGFDDALRARTGQAVQPRGR